MDGATAARIDEKRGEDGELVHRFHAAMSVAREAGMVARTAFLSRPTFSAANLKGPQDYLTETDGAVEKLIRSRFAEAFPEDGFFGEEGGGSRDGVFWLVDPIDGTANFARGIPVFCISIAYVQNGVAEIGVIFDPMQQELFAARRRGGASLDGRSILASTITDPHLSTVEIGWSTRLPHETYVDAVARAKRAGCNVRRSGSGALALAYVAAGRMDAYGELHMNAWDAVAGQLLVREAGGRTNNFFAGDGLLRGNYVLAAAAGLYEEMNRIMRPAS